MQLGLSRSMGLGSSTGSSGGGAPAALQQLYWGYQDGTTFEGAPAGEAIGTPLGRSSGTTLSLVSIGKYIAPVDGTGTGPGDLVDAVPATLQAASSTLVAISGSAIATGATAFPATSGIGVTDAYHATLRETRASDGATRDTVLPILVKDMPRVGASYSEDFGGYTASTTVTAATKLRNIAGWTYANGADGSTSVSTTNQDNAWVYDDGNSNPKLRIDPAAANTRIWYRSLGSSDGEITFPFLGTQAGQTGADYMTIWVRLKSGTSDLHARLEVANAGTDYRIQGRTGGGGFTVGGFQASTTNKFLAGDTIKIRFVGDDLTVWRTRGGVTTQVPFGPSGTKNSDGFTVDLSAVGKADRIAVGTVNGTGFILFDSITAQSVVGLSVSQLQKCYAFDWTANAAAVPLRGSMPSAQTGVEWRLWNVDLGAVVSGYDWANLSPTIASSTQNGFTFNMFFKSVNVPRPSGIHSYRIDIRDPANTTNTASSAQFGVGIVDLGEGQSNKARDMAQASAAGSFLLTGTRDATGKGWFLDGTVAGASPTAIGTQRVVAGYIDELITRFNCPVMVVAAAAGGHAIEDLQYQSTTRATTTWSGSAVVPGHVVFDRVQYNMYQHAARISTMDIDQGEANNTSLMSYSDTSKGKPYPNWYTDQNVQLFYDRSRLCGQRLIDLPVGIALLNNNVNTPTVGAQPNSWVCRQAQTAVATAIQAMGGTAMVTHHKFDCDMDVETGTPYNLHITYARKYQKIMQRQAEGLARMKGLITTDGRGPIVTSLTRISDTVFEVGMDMNGATGLSIDSGAGAGWSIVQATGAADPTSYFVNGLVPIALAATPLSIVGGKLRITLASPYAGRLAMLYGIGLRQYSGVWGVDSLNPFNQTVANGVTYPPQVRGTGYSADLALGSVAIDATTSGTRGVCPMMTALAA